MNGIFISYRQDDTKAWALRLRDELVRRFGKDSVFLDKDSIHGGQWREQIRTELERCRAVIVLIGPRWLTIPGEDGTARIQQPDDVHRGEIALALARPEVTVIPVLVEGAALPRAEELPPELRALAEWQSRRLSDDHQHLEVDLRLITADLEQATGLVARHVEDEENRSVVATALGGLGRLARAVAYAFAIGLSLIVFAQLALGWDLSPGEGALVVLIVLGVELAVAALRGRRRRVRDAPA